MDGLLLAAYMFPLVLLVSCTCSVMAFLLSLWAGFGPAMARAARRELGGHLPAWAVELLYQFFDNPPLKSVGGVVYPMLICCSIILTVGGSYSLGKVLYRKGGKGGWQFAQPLRGGIRFVVLQTVTWCLVALALTLPWLSVESIGVWAWLNWVPATTAALADGGDQSDKGTFGGLLVSSASLGMLCQSLVIVSLMVFDADSPAVSRRALNLREIETGTWNWDKMFGSSSQKFWWVFVGLQCLATLYAGLVAYLAEQHVAQGIIKNVMITVFIILFICSVALTNSVGGKWRHGEVAFHIYMPFRGGLGFMLLQAAGWVLFSFVIAICIAKLFVPAPAIEAFVAGAATLLGSLHGSSARDPAAFASALRPRMLPAAAVMALASQLCIVASLLFFNPQLAGKSLLVKQLERNRNRAGEPASSANASPAAAVSSFSSAAAAAAAAPAAAPASGRGPPSRRSRTPAREQSQPPQQQLLHEPQGELRGLGVEIDPSPRGRRSSSASASAGALERIVGKFKVANNPEKVLVEWSSGLRDWYSLEQLHKLVPDETAIAAALRVYASSSIGQLSDDDKAQQQQPVQQSAEARGRAAAAAAPSQSRARARTPEFNPQSAPVAEQEWEEMEDESGNVYWYCESTGKTSMEAPTAKPPTPQAAPATRRATNKQAAKKTAAKPEAAKQTTTKVTRGRSAAKAR
jgi:hypothetical protein